MAILKEIDCKAKYVKSVIDYVKKDAKTADGYYVEGINCDPNKAASEFMTTQQLWKKTDGRRYFHYVMSWDMKDSITPKQALEIVNEWISKTPKLDGHQILIAAHLDQKNGNIHVHIVGNSVNMLTGIKMHRNAHELADWKKLCNEINLDHGFQPPRKKTRAEKRHNPTIWKKEEFQALQFAHQRQQNSFKEYILESLIDVYTRAINKIDFISLLAEKGIETVWKETKKNITFTADKIEANTDKRTIRDSNLERTFGFRCDKETLEIKFKENFEQQQTKRKEELDGQRKRESAELLRIAREFERRKSAATKPSRYKGHGDSPTSTTELDIAANDPAAAILQRKTRDRISAAERANRDAERERLAAQKADYRKQKSKVEQRSIAERTETKRTGVAKRTTSKRGSSQEYGRN